MAVAFSILSIAFWLRSLYGTIRLVSDGVAPALLAASVAGVSLGSSAALRAARACTGELDSGDLIAVGGVTRETVSPRRSARLTLGGATVERLLDGRRCRLSGLIVRVEAVTARIPAGSPVRVRGEWAGFGRASAWPRRPSRTGLVVGDIEAPPGTSGIEIDRSDIGLRRLGGLQRIRSLASDRLSQRLPTDVSPVARALLLSERDELSGETRRRFADAGLAHLLAISGLHVGLLAGALVLILRSMLGPSGAAVGAAALVTLYVGAIGAPPSAVRACVLVVGWAVARCRGIRVRPWDVLGLAALLVLVRDPLTLLEPGFQLSFAGFAGLGAGATVWRTGVLPAARRARGTAQRLRMPRGVRRRARLLGLACFSSAGAFAATVPISAAHFQHVAPIALVSHFVGTPLVAAAIASLIMTLVLPPPLSGLAAAAATVVLRWMALVVEWIAGLPGGHSWAAAPSASFWIAALLICAGAWEVFRWGRLGRGILPFAFGTALWLAGPAFGRYASHGRTLLCTLDVGQGDAAVLRTEGGRWILFDAGPRFGRRDAGRDVVLPTLRRFGARRIDLFVLSHPDLDHLGGFQAVREGIPVFRVLDSGHPIPTAPYLRFLATAREEGFRWLSARPGDLYRLDNVRVRVLGPIDPSAGGSDVAAGGIARANETSLVLRISIGPSFVYLNSGDATADDERALLSRWGGDSLRADVLKVGHHGSRTSSSPAFLAAVNPDLAIISAGRGNAYGHPHAVVLDRLGAASVRRIWRTDRDGTACVEVDDDLGWRVAGEREWKPARGSGTRLDGATR